VVKVSFVSFFVQLLPERESSAPPPPTMETVLPDPTEKIAVAVLRVSPTSFLFLDGCA
jgi:hypothetical protein